jgi:hypothetical protein
MKFFKTISRHLTLSQRWWSKSPECTWIGISPVLPAPCAAQVVGQAKEAPFDGYSLIVGHAKMREQRLLNQRSTPETNYQVAGKKQYLEEK